MTKGQKRIKRICSDICNKLGGHAAHLAKEVFKLNDTRPITYYGVHQFNGEGPIRARILLGTHADANHIIYEIYARQEQ